MREGVQSAIDKAANGGTTYAGCLALKNLLGCSIEFIYACRRKGHFPIDKARLVSDTYGVPLADIVKADLRAALNAQL